MDYGTLIKRSWTFTWRYRFLWLLGLFAPSSVGACSPPGGGGTGWRADSQDFANLPADVQDTLFQLGAQVMRNLDVILLVAGIILLLVIAFIVISLIAQGGMAHGTARLALGQPASLGGAWEAGLGLFWRYLGLALLMIGIGIGLAIVAGVAGFALFAVIRITGGAAQVILIGLSALLGLAAFLVVVLFFLVLTISGAFAQRAMAIDGVGPIAGLSAGLRLIRAHPGTTILAWLVNLGLGIAALFVVLAGLLTLVIPLGIVGAVVYVGAGLSALLAIYVGIAALIVFLGLWALGGVSNCYFWHYWTLVYLRFTGRLTEHLEVVPAE